MTRIDGAQKVHGVVRHNKLQERGNEHGKDTALPPQQRMRNVTQDCSLLTARRDACRGDGGEAGPSQGDSKTPRSLFAFCLWEFLFSFREVGELEKLRSDSLAGLSTGIVTCAILSDDEM